MNVFVVSILGGMVGYVVSRLVKSKFDKMCDTKSDFLDTQTINRKLIAILRRMEIMSETLDQVLLAVQEESTVADSIIVLLDGIEQQLKDALSGTKLSPSAQAKVDAIFETVTANKTKLAEAITANTSVEVSSSSSSQSAGA